MQKKKSMVIFLMLSLMVLSMQFPGSSEPWSDDTPLYEVLSAFGETLPPHAPDKKDQELIERGRDLIFYGRTKGPDGSNSKFISKFYVCTSCHSPVREDPDLRSFDPEARLDYVAEKGQKFLQGSPFYGISNRESWYNDDYVLKYGDLVIPASKSLAESVQLCAKVCSSGRYLEDWELEAILAYYWDNQIQLGDLDLSKEERNKIDQAGRSSNQDLVALIKSKYAQKSPATFGKVPDQPMEGYGLAGRPEKGKLIYELSCQSCHQEEGVSGMTLTNDKLSFQKFKRHLRKKTDYNLYEISRHGTYAATGKPRYMPLYTEERMSNQQLEDLRAYVLQEAK